MNFSKVIEYLEANPNNKVGNINLYEDTFAVYTIDAQYDSLYSDQIDFFMLMEDITNRGFAEEDHTTDPDYPTFRASMEADPSLYVMPSNVDLNEPVNSLLSILPGDTAGNPTAIQSALMEVKKTWQRFDLK